MEVASLPSRGGTPWQPHAGRVDKECSAGQNERLRSMRLRFARSSLPFTRARVAELADALRSGCSDRQVVEGRGLSLAPIIGKPIAPVPANEIPLAPLQEQP